MSRGRFSKNNPNCSTRFFEDSAEEALPDPGETRLSSPPSVSSNTSGICYCRGGAFFLLRVAARGALDLTRADAFYDRGRPVFVSNGFWTTRAA